MKTIYIMCKKFNLPLDEATFVAGSEESYKCQASFTAHLCVSCKLNGSVLMPH